MRWCNERSRYACESEKVRGKRVDKATALGEPVIMESRSLDDAAGNRELQSTLEYTWVSRSVHLGSVVFNALFSLVCGLKLHRSLVTSLIGPSSRKPHSGAFSHGSHIYILRLLLTASIYHSYSFFVHGVAKPIVGPTRTRQRSNQTSCSTRVRSASFRLCHRETRVSSGRISGMQIESRDSSKNCHGQWGTNGSSLLVGGSWHYSK